jgi:hypothetical protein
MQVQSKAFSMQQLVYKKHKHTVHIEYEDLLVPQATCDELLPRNKSTTGVEYHHTGGKGLMHSDKAETARSIMQGASRATLGSMLM